MNKNRIRLYVSLAVVFVVFTVIAFAVPFPRGGAFWLSYVFALVALAAQLYILPKAFDRQGHEARSKFYGFPIARVGVIYLCIQLALSLLFMALSFVKCPAWVPAVVCVLVLAAALLGLIVTDAVRDEVERQDSKRKADTLGMKKLYAAVAACADRCADLELKKALGKLAEELRFSDPVSTEATLEAENTLRNYLFDLETAVDAGNVDHAKELCIAMRSALADRNRLSKLGK